MTSATAGAPRALPKASLPDSLAAVAEVLAPTIAKGVIVRRPRMTALAERMNLDQRAVQRMQRLRAKYGAGPLLLRIPLRPQALLLSPDHVHRVLENTPDPFSTASFEKRAALAHLGPKASLISEGPKRSDRRWFNEEVLESGNSVHRLAERFMAVVEQEVQNLLTVADARGELRWEEFIVSWYAMVRRVVLGDGARDDHDLTDMLTKLRSAGNWAFARPKRKDLLVRFHKRLEEYLEQAAPGSLAGVIASRPKGEDTAPSHQVAHWLFAFDPGGMATFRALALLAAHPEEAERAREEIAAAQTKGKKDLPFIRACFLEALRLWPTTPAVLRETKEETEWENGTMPKHTNILIFAPFFHRDDENLPYADRFHPDLWTEGLREGGWPLIPFSGGPAICPARNLVPMLGSATLAELLNGRRAALKKPTRLNPKAPLPRMLDNYTLSFVLEGRGKVG